MRSFLTVIVHVGSLFPLFWLGYDWFFNNLTVNPIQDLTFRTGKPALILLTAALAITPLKTFTGWHMISGFRRTFGLYSAFYASLHLSVFIGLDYFFDWELILETIIEKPYILVGFAAFCILSTLAFTSTKGWKKRLGKNWRRLHLLVYLAGALVVLHFVWLVKSDIREPVVYGIIMSFLMLLRFPFFRRNMARLRKT